MFRNPRENVRLSVDEVLLPSVGRPPTPPTEITNSQSMASYSAQASAMVTTNKSAYQNPRLPVIGRQTAPKTSSAKKSQNKSILSFFNKADKSAEPDTTEEPGLFIEEDRPSNDGYPPEVLGHDSGRDSLLPESPFNHANEDRYNELDSPVKRRKLDEDLSATIRTPSPERSTSQERVPSKEPGIVTLSRSSVLRSRGGFVDDSDDETEQRSKDDADQLNAHIPTREGNIEPDSVNLQDEPGPSDVEIHPQGETGIHEKSHEQQIPAATVPMLSREATSVVVGDDFAEGDDFTDDEFYEGGEEFMERRWMEEQAEMEAAFNEDDDSPSESTASVMTPGNNEIGISEHEQAQVAAATCPICTGSLRGLSEAQASSHVNACLDGTAASLPKHDPLPQTDSVGTLANGFDNWQPKRLQRAALARPAQANPFSPKGDGKSSGASAFTRLMSGHAEDAAWAEAASHEAQSRGKPAYQRTCPFYKIMPGLYICVDAFRYGKVQGQNAYFLSHFHSDHYIGLTSSWCHGPIYASKVTTNLIRQQLRVAEKWLVPLEFEKKVEVPNTKGVFVTMIPANHCPGSSLYLFEKVISKNKDGSPKLNRILHCGDFRACPAHIHHPLLRPDVIDTVTSQSRQQTIDTCYLDTTYLTPKYAFPSQHDVISACAQMCVSLSKEAIDSNDAWEKVQAERAGDVMTKFLEQGSDELSPIKKEKDSGEDEDQKPRTRGRLLVVIGTYSIGKERICLGIAKALNTKIFAPPAKMRICKCLEDPELNSRLTSNPLEAQVHMQTLMEIRAETLHDYLVGFKPRFSRVVGFRPTGWNYRPPSSRFTENPSVATVLHSEGWKSRFSMRDLVPQRGSTREAQCFGVPYSEHSSFRELSMFCCALRIGRVVPTVNVGSARSREKMKGWIEKWDGERRRNGLFRVEVGEGAEGWGSGDGSKEGGLRYGV